MKIGFQIKGLEAIRKKFVQLERETKAGQIKTVQESIFLIHSIAVQSIQANNDGRSVTRYSPLRVVNVSSAGDPPNTDTGRLVQSIKFDFKDGGLIGRVGTNLKYGAYLEFGTESMLARPWLAPAVAEASKEIAKIFEKNIKAVLNDVASN